MSNNLISSNNRKVNIDKILTVVSNIQDLKNIEVSSLLGSNPDYYVDVLGYYEKGDGGGGQFYWDSDSTETDNGGTIIQATGVTIGRWKRVYNGLLEITWFGGSNGSVPTSGTWILGVVSYNLTPTPGGNIGWVCTSPGTPGTWKSFGSIAS